VDKWLTAEEVAGKLQVTPATVKDWCLKGVLRSAKVGNKILRIKPEWVEDMMLGKKRR
jgi:excisionase family DNA binding protein